MFISPAGIADFLNSNKWKLSENQINEILRNFSTDEVKEGNNYVNKSNQYFNQENEKGSYFTFPFSFADTEQFINSRENPKINNNIKGDGKIDSLANLDIDDNKDSNLTLTGVDKVYEAQD